MNRIKLMTVLLTVAACCAACNSSNEELVPLNEVDITQDSSEQSAEEDASGRQSGEIHSGLTADTGTQTENKTEITASPAPAAEICVHVCGAVQHPGVYTVPETTRVYEVMEAAGGLTETAAADYLNQAASLTDGQRVYVPTMDEVSKNQIPAEMAADIPVSSSSDRVVPESTGSMVNINTATAEQLKELPGVGDSRAQSIIAYREARGGFKSKEEIMQVEGIKEGMYSKMKDLIQVQ
ncbi:MAG: helix-hairpin-helix domain-containing protein [bacterium]|nr:helix-hairpin-helix domain-containing protein [bacterium]